MYKKATIKKTGEVVFVLGTTNTGHVEVLRTFGRKSNGGNRGTLMYVREGNLNMQKNPAEERAALNSLV